MNTKIRIGTRASKLALWQAHYIESILQKNGLETEIITMETKGDLILNQPLSEIGSKGLFTEELEVKLTTGEIDIAVHSAKDMQSELNTGLEIIAFTKREKPNDVLVSLDKNFSLENQSGELIVGTSSTRRKAVLRRNYPHVKIVDCRGNLQTRFRKMEEGHYQAMLLAYAGVHRMGYDNYIVKLFPLDEFTPAVGQGSVAIEISSTLDKSKKDKIRALTNHIETEYCLLAERAFLKKLQGGCSVPLFALATFNSDSITINGGIISLDGKELIEESVSGEAKNAEAIGEELAASLLKKGAGIILENIKLQKNK
ncbi:MAG TPA: hydroxymethylbilane synthase [Cytophagaceae bacterium]|jgi:hydroxymethylbilane synthase|nr:hydroxymethylbilane synthase [Cytophagaceae bacterium]